MHTWTDMQPGSYRLSLASLACAIFLAAQPALAQTVRGAVVGRVTDAGGKPISSASVTLVDEETNRERSTTADSNGEFAVALLPAGAYRIEASSPNYRKSIRNVLLLVNQEINIEMPLLAETSSEQIIVTAQAGLLKTESATQSEVIQNRAIVNLPLDGRNFYELTLLVPGAVPPAQGSAGSDRGDFTFNINGAREDSNYFLLDGIFNSDPKLNGFSVAPS